MEYNAASDAYTNSPQEFKEFYNQRRRWGPSTLANTLDLLHSGKETSKRNSSISMLYIFYQIFTVASSILGPASVTLMVAGQYIQVFTFQGSLGLIDQEMSMMRKSLHHKKKMDCCISLTKLFFSPFSLGAFQFVFSIEGTLSIIIAVIPPVVYMLICFFTKSNFQITIAAILSVLYAFLMTASFFSIIGE